MLDSLAEYSKMNDFYIKSINRVVDHIQNNLDSDMKIKELSSIAGFSQFHFGRLFKSEVGETIHQFIKRLRIEKAAVILLTNEKLSVTEIAMSMGFSTPSSFAKSFRQHFKMSASKWREIKKDIFSYDSTPVEIEKDRLWGADGSRRWNINHGETIRTVVVEDIPVTRVAYMRNIGPYEGDGDLFAKLYEALFKWATPRELSENIPYTINIYHDHHRITDSQNHRVMASIPVPSEIKPSLNVGISELSGGKYGISRFMLYEDQFDSAWQWLENVWLKNSGYVHDDRETLERCYLESIKNNKRIYDVDLCIPVKIPS